MIKKITLTSVVAAATIFTNLQADSIEKAFKDGKVKGDIKAYYFQEDYDVKGKASNLHFGGILGYETGSFNGLSAGATFQVSSVADLSKTDKTNENIFASDEDASGSVLSEAFISYTRGDSSFKAGRQFIGTPLLAGSGSRMVRQSFQGYTYTNKSLSDTEIMVAYVDRFQARTDGAGNPGKFTKTFNTNGGLDPLLLDDGAYTLYLQNKSIENLAIQAQYLDATDVFSSVYLDAQYDFNKNLYVAGQYMGTSYDNNNPSGSFYAARVGGNFEGFNFKLSASQNPSDGNVESGLGYGADWALTGAEINGGYYSYLKDTTAYQVGLGTNIAGVDANIIHSVYDLELANDVKETDLILSYDLMKNLNLNILQAYFDGGDKNYETRVKLTYKF